MVWLIPLSILIIGAVFYFVVSSGILSRREEIVVVKNTKIMTLSIEDARHLAIMVLENRAVVTVEEVRLGDADAALLGSAHHSARELILKYRRFFMIVESDTRFGVGSIKKIELEGAMVQVGLSLQDNYQLASKEDSPVLYEIFDGQISGTHPSIYHFILMVTEGHW